MKLLYFTSQIFLQFAFQKDRDLCFYITWIYGVATDSSWSYLKAFAICFSVPNGSTKNISAQGKNQKLKTENPPTKNNYP